MTEVLILIFYGVLYQRPSQNHYRMYLPVLHTLNILSIHLCRQTRMNALLPRLSSA